MMYRGIKCFILNFLMIKIQRICDQIKKYCKYMVIYNINLFNY
eukprot:UN05299